MVQLGPGFDLAKRLDQLERLVMQLAANQMGQAFSSTQSDGSVGVSIQQRRDQGGATAMMFYQGPSTPRDTNTGLHPVFLYLGQLVSGGVPEDAGALWYRPSGSQSAVIGNKGLQVYDTESHQVFGTDEYGSSASGVGLNNPWIPLGQPITNGVNNTGWPQTTLTSLSAVSFLQFPAQHSHITWYGTTYCPTGSAGEVQVTVNNGAAGAVLPVGAGFTYLNETFSLGGSWNWQQALALGGNAAVTSGPGPIYFAISGVWGRGTP